MKVFAYASLAVSAQASILDFIANEMENKIVYTHDGVNVNFAPYFVMNVEDYGMKGQIRSSKDGRNMDEDNWEQVGNGMKMWGSGFGANMADFPLFGEIFSEVNTYDYEGLTSMDQSMTGGSLTWDKEMDFKYHDGSSGSVNEEGEINISYAAAKAKMVVTIDSAIDRTNSNVDRFRFSPLFFMMDSMSWEGESKITVKNMGMCQRYFDSASGVCSVQYGGEMKLNNRNLGKISANLRLAEYAVQFKFGPNGGANQMVFVKSTDRNNKAVKLSEMQFWELYVAEGSKNWQAAIQGNTAMLVLRAPLCNALEENVLPQLYEMAEPFMDFADVAGQNMDKIPYAIFYMDKLFATMDDEFDCSEVVAASRIESDLFENGSLNEFLQDGCSDMNEAVVEFLQCPELASGMRMMRTYVKDMSSQSGEAWFDSNFGSVF